MYLFGHGMWLENETMGATTQATPLPLPTIESTRNKEQ